MAQFDGKNKQTSGKFSMIVQVGEPAWGYALFILGVVVLLLLVIKVATPAVIAKNLTLRTCFLASAKSVTKKTAQALLI